MTTAAGAARWPTTRSWADDVAALVLVLCLACAADIGPAASQEAECKPTAKAVEADPPILRFNLYHVPRASPPAQSVLLDECKAEELRNSSCGHSAEGNPIGETVHMRLGKAVSLPPDARRHFAAATLSQDHAAAERLLSPYLTESNGEVRWAAALALAYVTVRDTDPASAVAKAAIDRLGKESVGEPWRKTDWLYLSALRLHAAGALTAALTALAEATRVEAEFFAAHALTLRILLEREALQTGTERACRRHFRNLFSASQAIAAINPCPLAVAHLDRYLATELGRLDERSNPGRWAVHLYLAWVSNVEGAVQRAHGRLQMKNWDLPKQCQTDLIDTVASLLVRSNEANQ